MITARVCDASNRFSPLDPGRLEAELPQLLAQRKIVWLDLASPTQEEEELVLRRLMPVHPLTFEDVTRLRREPDAPPHFPKVEEFTDYLLVIVNPITTEYLHHVQQGHAGQEPRRFTQLSAVITDHVLITHHYEPLECVEEIRKFCDRHESHAARGPDYLFHLILDGTVDSYVPVLDTIDDTLDELQLDVIRRPRPAIFAKLVHLKQEIVQLRKTFILEREVLVRLTRGEFQLVSQEESAYYRNVYDHLVRFTELLESSRDMVSDLMQSYLASVNNRLSEIMKVLTMISTIVMPMNFIASIYGMNFEYMPGLHHPWGYALTIGAMALTGGVAFVFFRWRRWI